MNVLLNLKQNTTHYKISYIIYICDTYRSFYNRL